MSLLLFFNFCNALIWIVHVIANQESKNSLTRDAKQRLSQQQQTTKSQNQITEKSNKQGQSTKQSHENKHSQNDTIRFSQENKQQRIDSVKSSLENKQSNEFAKQPNESKATDPKTTKESATKTHQLNANHKPPIDPLNKPLPPTDDSLSHYLKKLDQQEQMRSKNEKMTRHLVQNKNQAESKTVPKLDPQLFVNKQKPLAVQKRSVKTVEKNTIIDAQMTANKTVLTESVKETSENSKGLEQLKQSDVKEHARLMSQYALAGGAGSDIRFKIEKQRKKLESQGLTTEEVQHMQAKVGQVVKEHIMYDLKSKIIAFHMSKTANKLFEAESSIAWQESAKNMDELIKEGRINTDQAAVISELKKTTIDDLSSFIYTETVDNSTKYALGQMSLDEFQSEIKKHIKIAQSAGITINEHQLMERITGAVETIGLTEFTPPQSGQQQSNQQSHKRPISREEQLDDKLRHLYMLKALHPSLAHKIKLHYKMTKCKNGMIQLGIYSDDREDELRQQGYFLAAQQYRDELRHIFREEATLPELAGPEFSILSKKKTFIIKRLKQIGFPCSDTALNAIKTHCYRDISSIIKKDILQLEAMTDGFPHISVTKQLADLYSTWNRLKIELGLDAEFSGNPLKRLIIKQSSINEAA